MTTVTGAVLRPAEPADAPFLADLFAEVHAPGLELLGWDAFTLRTFLDGQHEVREDGYRTSHPNADDAIVLVDGSPAGRLLVDRGATVLDIVDVALVGAARGQGVGTLLMRDLLDEATSTGRRIQLTVRKNNPARRLYERFGLEVVGETDMDLLLEAS